MPPTPEAPGPSPATRLSFAADPLSVREGLARLMASPPARALSPGDRGTAELVLAEVLNNIAEHAYAAGPGPVAVQLANTPFGLSCEVVDRGAPMPGGMLPPGQLPGGPGTALEDLPEGGFGWHLIRSLTRDLAYVRDGGRNRLSFLIPPETSG